ncbi:MAG: cyanophycinase [Chloroflexota bacterium]
MNNLPATTLMAIGGAMDLDGPGAALRELFRLGGGEHGRFVILPTASGLVNAGAGAREALVKLGAQHIPQILPVRSRLQALDPALLPAVEQATAIFFAGGDQLRITSFIGGAPLETALLAAHARGCLISGSSAGTAVLSQVMLAYGKSGPSPRAGMAQFAPGLGFTRRVIFDQHFRQRDRLGRLIYAVTNHPGLLGVGVDEDTAAVIETFPDGRERLRVIGRHAVTIVDGRPASAVMVADLEAGQPVAVAGLHVHVLTQGCEFDLLERCATLFEKPLELE